MYDLIGHDSMQYDRWATSISEDCTAFIFLQGESEFNPEDAHPRRLSSYTRSQENPRSTKWWQMINVMHNVTSFVLH